MHAKGITSERYSLNFDFVIFPQTPKTILLTKVENTTSFYTVMTVQQAAGLTTMSWSESSF